MSSLRRAASMAAGVMALLAAAASSAQAAPEDSVAPSTASPAPARPYVPVYGRDLEPAQLRP